MNWFSSSLVSLEIYKMSDSTLSDIYLEIENM